MVGLKVVMRWMTVRNEMDPGQHLATKTGLRQGLKSGNMRMSNINKQRMRLRQQMQNITWIAIKKGNLTRGRLAALQSHRCLYGSIEVQALIADLFHRFSEILADLLIAFGRDSADPTIPRGSPS